MKLLEKLPFKSFLNKIFNKLFLLYLLSYLLSMAALSFALSAYLEQAFIHREVDYMNVATDEAVGFIDGNIQLANKMIFNTYIECYNNRTIMDFLGKSYADESESYYRKSYYAYIGNVLSSRNDLLSIAYFRNDDQSIFSSDSSFRSDADRLRLVNELSLSGGKTAVMPLPGETPGQGYCYIKQFNNVFSWQPIGYFIMAFSGDGLHGVLAKYMRSFQCDFFITSGSSVLYELNEPREGESRFPSDELGSVAVGAPYTLAKLGGVEYYLIGKELETLGVKAFCTIPRSEIKRAVMPTQVTVLIVTTVVGLLFIFMLGFGNRMFSRRMNALIEQIRRVRGGDLSYNRKPAGKPDELGVISEHFNEMCRELQAYIDKTYRYELKQKEAEYKLLQMQINPHFLFNTLEAIRMKSAIEGFGEASGMIYNLSLLLRQTTKATSVHTLREEFAYCGLYLDLFASKFEQGLLYEIKADPDCEEFGIIRHIVQPLLENSIVHGFRPDGAGCRLAVEAGRSGGDLLVTIRDNGAGMDEEACRQWNARLASPAGEHEGDAIGLHNVNDRIRFVYGEGYGVTLMSRPGEGTLVSVRLKCLSPREVLELVQPANR